eukprot:TRINITY_DN13442_c0_g1_i1.p1 TRINITY_DN13442_c0_g1~~TRINITY_DN13442_c0_g1_i1.p1  ORF type:complete len:200 (+),score=4.58 TRINITY_DN13442_c0_g1_i1:62-601(+)
MPNTVYSQGSAAAVMRGSNTCHVHRQGAESDSHSSCASVRASCRVSASTDSSKPDRLRSTFGWMRRKIAIAVDGVSSLFAGARQQFGLPERRRRSEAPIVPSWAVVVVIILAVSLSTVALILPFHAKPGMAEPSAIDASAKHCGRGMSMRSAAWLFAAVWLSAGLCPIHPVQSAVLLGF